MSLASPENRATLPGPITKVVYYDNSYPFGWVPDHKAAQVSHFFVNNGYVHKNADLLGQWMAVVISSGIARNTVVVMAQDVVPDTVAPEASPTVLVRRYLEAGGRMVWIGDVPFFYQSKSRSRVPVNSQRPEWNIGGMYNVLGAVSASVVSRGPCDITPEGGKRGLRTSWVSAGPVSLKWLEGGEVLATTNLLGGVTLDDIAPQRIGEESHSLASSVIAARELVEAAKVLAEVLFIAGLTFLATTTLVPESVGTIPVRLPLTFGIPVTAAAIVVYLWRKKRRRRTYASGWVKRYGENGEFVRLWDQPDPPVDSARLGELLAVANSQRTQ